jgi:lysophospholipase L1-like esterase
MCSQILEGEPMRNSSIRLAVVTVFLGLLASGPARADLKIMPLGDSNTGIDPDLFPDPDVGPAFENLNKYRQELYNQLTADGYDVNFVGTQNTGQSGLADWDNEAHGGYRIPQIAYGPGENPASPSGGVQDWLASLAAAGQTPDVVLLMIGTNDILDGASYRNAASTNLGNLIDLLTGELPDARIIVASIPPMTYSDTKWNGYVNTYNATIPGLVASRAAAGKHVEFIDINAALTPADISSDHYHLNAPSLHPSRRSRRRCFCWPPPRRWRCDCENGG